MPTEQPVQNVCRECTKLHKRKLRATIAVPVKSCPSQVLPNAWIAFLGNFKTKKVIQVVSNVRVVVNSTQALLLAFLLPIV